MVFTDARQKIERGAVRLLMENFADPDVGAVSGELMLGDPADGETKRHGTLLANRKASAGTGSGVRIGGGRDRSALCGAAGVAADGA